MDLHGSPWISVDLHGSSAPWVSVDPQLRGSPWISGDPQLAVDLRLIRVERNVQQIVVRDNSKNGECGQRQCGQPARSDSSARP